jgi:MFS family permease
MGLIAMATPLGSAALSLVYQFFITHYGWRSAFMALGIALWVLVVIPGVIFLRRQPEDLGVYPDGIAAPRFTPRLISPMCESLPVSRWSGKRDGFVGCVGQRALGHAGGAVSPAHA